MNFDNLRRLQDHLVEWRVPGNDCMICKDGEEIYRYASGCADIEKRREMRGDELYFVWSASKVITTSLALRLHEEGKFTMDEPVSRYLPEFEKMMVKREVDGREEIVPAKNEIRIGQLFNMTAAVDYTFSTPAVAEVRKATDGRCPTREIVRAIAKAPLLSEPGETWLYTLSHDVLGGLIEVICGKRLRDYAKEVLFEPLGMEDTSYNLPSAEKLDRMAVQYIYRSDLGKCLPTNNVCQHILGPDYDSGGAGVVSTCADYMKFASTIANYGKAKNGYRYLTKASIDMWRTNTLTEKQFATYDCPLYRGYGYGYGVRTMMKPGIGGSLSPVGEFGWGGAAGTWVIIDPSNNLALVYTQHMLECDFDYFALRLRNVAYACLER